MRLVMLVLVLLVPAWGASALPGGFDVVASSRVTIRPTLDVLVMSTGEWLPRLRGAAVTFEGFDLRSYTIGLGTAEVPYPLQAYLGAVETVVGFASVTLPVFDPIFGDSHTLTGRLGELHLGQNPGAFLVYDPSTGRYVETTHFAVARMHDTVWSVGTQTRSLAYGHFLGSGTGGGNPLTFEGLAADEQDNAWGSTEDMIVRHLDRPGAERLELQYKAGWEVTYAITYGPVPEPSTALLLGLGLVGLALNPPAARFPSRPRRDSRGSSGARKAEHEVSRTRSFNFLVECHEQERGDRAQEDREEEPVESAPVLPLGDPGVDQGQSSPPDEVA